MAAVSVPSSSLNRFVGWLSGWIGFVLVAVGLICLALALLPRLAPDVATQLPLELPQGGLPIWGGAVLLILGAACYVWGRGMLQYRAWAPFVAAISLFNLGLYLAVFGVMVSERVIAPPAWMLAQWDIYRAFLNATIAIVGIFLGLLVILLLFGPGGLRTAYVYQYQKRPSPQYTVCPTCRSIITRTDGTCSWCEPRHTQANLEPEGARAGEELVPLAFSSDRNRILVGRRTPDRPPAEPGHVYLDPRVHNQYETVSSLHAAFAYDYGNKQFLVEDLGSSNGTRLIRNQAVTSLTPQQNYALADGDVIELGDARFTFRIVSVETS